ncbi:hypothetical protein EG327_004119 [Venturia inaequalis]|uniref:Uncharacterized protein n=1 Tax=Venturia inaequalis TaxID=5025 RepID=A0A8H3ZB00_VENIN|nr:hypothetical protein EG327_004119 [Venturia inaequalis]
MQNGCFPDDPYAAFDTFLCTDATTLSRGNMELRDSKSKHLAFRAHGRRVFTCLQFDGDKIITGSDDKHIHVYDTKTGHKIKRLIGDGGGVWTLQNDGNTLASGPDHGDYSFELNCRSEKSWNKLRGQGFQLVGYIDCVNWISDKQKDVSDMEKDARDQIAIIAFYRHETVGKIDQLVRRFAIVETYVCAVDAAMIDPFTTRTRPFCTSQKLSL